MPSVPPAVPKFEQLEKLAESYPELDATAIRTCLILLRVAGRLSTSFDEHFARFGLSQGRFTLLMLLRRHPEGMSPAALAQAAGVTRPTVTGILDTLQSSGLVKRQTEPHDHRVIRVTLTDAAHRLLRAMLPIHFRRHASIMAEMDKGERETLVGLLRRIESRVTSGELP